ncbi:MAG: RnfABCDGE type electron transport complex subunit B [bacterium]|nr:RnfABCDGE type electron transport complex subunit B [bacterium]
MLIAVGALAALGLLLGVILSMAARFLSVETDPLADELEQMLPNLQCGQCGFVGCRPAAEALSAGETDVTLCPPGGVALAAKLAEKLHVEIDLSQMDHEPLVAFVHEENCIGCTKCILVCPTDCIIGAPKKLHTVIVSACVGGAACLEVCPTDCIEMVPVTVKEESVQSWNWPKPRSPQSTSSELATRSVDR